MEVWQGMLHSSRDGKILVSGLLKNAEGMIVNTITKVNNDDTDTTFDPGIRMNGYLTAITFQESNKIIIGGGALLVQWVGETGFTDSSPHLSSQSGASFYIQK